MDKPLMRGKYNCFKAAALVLGMAIATQDIRAENGVEKRYSVDINTNTLSVETVRHEEPTLLQLVRDADKKYKRDLKQKFEDESKRKSLDESDIAWLEFCIKVRLSRLYVFNAVFMESMGIPADTDSAYGMAFHPDFFKWHKQDGANNSVISNLNGFHLMLDKAMQRDYEMIHSTGTGIKRFAETFSGGVKSQGGEFTLPVDLKKDLFETLVEAKDEIEFRPNGEKTKKTWCDDLVLVGVPSALEAEKTSFADAYASIYRQRNNSLGWKSDYIDNLEAIEHLLSVVTNTAVSYEGEEIIAENLQDIQMEFKNILSKDLIHKSRKLVNDYPSLLMMLECRGMMEFYSSRRGWFIRFAVKKRYRELAKEFTKFARENSPTGFEHAIIKDYYEKEYVPFLMERLGEKKSKNLYEGDLIPFEINGK